MRIAQIAPLTEAVPPKLYGGTERVVSYLTEELVAMGHDVTLFASGDSCTSARLRAMWPQALRFDPAVMDLISPTLMMMEDVRRVSETFDMLHFHVDHWPFSLFTRQRTPFVTTLHGRLDLAELPPIYARFPGVPVVSISEAQRAPLPQANFVATIQHGLPSNLLRPLSRRPDYLAFLGRICPEKGPERAIEIARRSGLPLRIAAKVDRVDQRYFEECVRPLLGEPGVEFFGEIAEHEKAEFLSGALALLSPIDWPEPFGLVMIEAMACGTPVITFDRGSVREILEDGLTGFIVDDVETAISAAGRIGALDRTRIRSEFERRFTARRMAEGYVALYEQLIMPEEQSRRAAGVRLAV
ncbi:MAG TPA: glycosyltransferase family 4 protein [Acetobacteraceae bacterium]|nr:glycosyltransferase family 4 protein [Acetobacteraceae bacterium]